MLTIIRESLLRESLLLSYGLLSALMVGEALLLREVLGRAAKVSRSYSRTWRRNQPELTENLPWYLAPGTRAPEFTAELLGTGRTLTRADLEGRETILLFVSPADADSPAYYQMAPALASMWETVEGEVYLVCKGIREDCQRLIGNSPVRAILDEDGRIAQGFLVDRTPRAVELDEEARVARYGEPDATRMALQAIDDDDLRDEVDAGTTRTDHSRGSYHRNGTHNGAANG